MFKGNMNAIKYGKIAEASVVPFIRASYPDRHQLQQDNNLKHHNNHIKKAIIYWSNPPPESSDLNPVKNCLGSIKQYMRMTYKITNTQELIDGIDEFWNFLTPNVWIKYISDM